MAGAAPFVASEKLSRLLQRSIDGAELVGHEGLRLAGWVYMNTRNWENMHYQYLSGMLTPSEWTAFRRNLRFLFHIPAFQESWELEQGMYSDASRKEVEDLRSGGIGGEKSMLDKKSETALSTAALAPEQ